MAQRFYSNAPATSLALACSAVATAIKVTSTAGLPIQYPYILILERGTASEEVVLVTAGTGTTLTVTRGYDSTTAFDHSEGAVVEHGISAIDPREANAHVNATANVHGVTGSLVGTTQAQTLTNKNLTSATNTFPSTLATDAELSATQGELDAHVALTSAHGTVGAVVGERNVQTLENKTISADLNDINGFPFNSFIASDGTGKLNGTTLRPIPAGDVVGTSAIQTLSNKTLTSPVITGVGEVLRAFKSADESVSGTSTLQDDNHLSVSLGVGTYLIDMWLTATSSTTTPDLAFAFTYGGVHSAIGYSGMVADLVMTGVSSHSMRTNVATTEGEALRMGLNSANGAGIVRGFITTTTSGLLKFQWAQDVSTGELTTVRAGSWLRAERVS